VEGLSHGKQVPGQLAITESDRDVASAELRITVAGELDLASAPELERRLWRLAATGLAIRIDLAGVTFMDSVGLAVLVQQSAAANRDDRAFEVDQTGLQPQVARLFAITGVAEILTSFPRAE
jgi:anti-sigma B factor antagonist